MMWGPPQTLKEWLQFIWFMLTAPSPQYAALPVTIAPSSLCPTCGRPL